MPLWDYLVKARSEKKAPTNADLIQVFEEVQALKEATGVSDILELLTTYAESWEIVIPPEVWPNES